jgi:hypothetical protein
MESQEDFQDDNFQNKPSLTQKETAGDGLVSGQ